MICSFLCIDLGEEDRELESFMNLFSCATIFTVLDAKASFFFSRVCDDTQPKFTKHFSISAVSKLLYNNGTHPLGFTQFNMPMLNLHTFPLPT